MKASALAGLTAIIVTALVGLIGMYSIVAAFAFYDVPDYGRACFGMLNLLTVHLVIIRYEIQKGNDR